MGPAAPEFGSPDSYLPPEMEADTLEVHSIRRWKEYGKLILVIDADGWNKGLRRNPRATYLLNGNSNPDMPGGGMIVYGPAVCFADLSADSSEESLEMDVATGREINEFGKSELLAILGNEEDMDAVEGGKDVGEEGADGVDIEIELPGANVGKSEEFADEEFVEVKDKMQERPDVEEL